MRTHRGSATAAARSLPLLVLLATCFAVLGVALTAPSPTSAASDAEAEPGTESELEPEILDMTPDKAADWSLRYLWAPIASIFVGGPGYFYDAREVYIDTTPSGGMVDLFYVRSNFQKRFEQAETPVKVVLPSWLNAGPRDSLTIRAFAEGYRQETVTMSIRSRQDEVNIDLEPLPNTLDGIAHRYFAGRSSVSFLTKESLTFRLQEADDGFSVILTETAMSKEAKGAVEGMVSPLIDEVYDQQLGEDLMVRVMLTDRGSRETEVRSRQDYDAARELYTFMIELVPADGGAEAVAGALAGLKGLSAADVTGCSLVFDQSLRERLDAGALNRALVPRGDFTDPYLRAAMRRQGEIAPGGDVAFTDGSTYKPGVPIELEMSLSQAGNALGYLAVLRSFVAAVEGDDYFRETYRSLIAPELPVQEFTEVLDAAEASERVCRAKG